MREVEVKAKIKDKESLVKKLEGLGCIFSPPTSQSDVIYTMRSGTVKDFTSNDVFLRLRTSNGKILFTAKKRLTNSLDRIEHEVEVSSNEEMEQVLILLGFAAAVKITKTRTVTHYNGDEVCIDDVGGLGSFIEVERLTDADDIGSTQEKLFEFLESLGISKDDRVTSSYDILMIESGARSL